MTVERTELLLEKLRQYLLAECFVAIDPKPLEMPSGLSLGARNQFTAWGADLYGLSFAFLVPERRVEEAPSRFLNLWEQVATPIEKTGKIPVFLTDKFSLPARRILVANHVPFVVPGSHLYLPHVPAQFRDDLLDRIPPVRRAKLAPSTQYFLTSFLQCRAFPPNQSEYDDIFGVSRMTISRIVTELEERGWIRVTKEGRSHFVELAGSAREIWDEAKEYLTSPVMRRFSLEEEVPEFQRVGFPAGYSALSQYTMIGDNAWPTVAITREVEEKHERLIRELVTSMKESCKMKVEVWQYPPALPEAVAGKKAMPDLLSLILSFSGPQDERTEQALEELEKQITWSKE